MCGVLVFEIGQRYWQIYVQLMAGDSFDASEVLTGPGEFPNFLTRGDTFDRTLSSSGPADINLPAHHLPPTDRNHCVQSYGQWIFSTELSLLFAAQWGLELRPTLVLVPSLVRPPPPDTGFDHPHTCARPSSSIACFSHCPCCLPASSSASRRRHGPRSSCNRTSRAWMEITGKGMFFP